MKYAVAIIVALAAAVVLLPAPADAGCRRVGAQHAAVVVESAVVAAPVVSVTTSNFLAVPTVAYPVLGAGYSQPDPNIKRLADALERIEAKLAGPSPPTPLPSPKAGEGSKPSPIMPRAEGASAPTDWPDAPKLLAAVQSTCARCHGAANPKAGLPLVTADGKLANLSELAKLKAFRAVSLGTMPPGGQPVSDDVLQLFADWPAH